jgi:hypothetical protein
MGNGAAGTKLSNAPIEELADVIEAMIATYPLMLNGHESSMSQQDVIREIVTDMRRKGYRPITPQEYRQELKFLESHKNSRRKISLWKAIENDELKTSEVEDVSVERAGCLTEIDTSCDFPQDDCLSDQNVSLSSLTLSVSSTATTVDWSKPSKRF